MVCVHYCIPCQYGDHDGCSGGRAAPPGMIGGWECPCEGECRTFERRDAVVDAVVAGPSDGWPPGAEKP